MSLNSNSLKIIAQHSLQKEVKEKEGSELHFVVKNSPFTITLAANSPSLDLMCTKITYELLYDRDESEEKAVDYIKDKPLDCKLKVVKNIEDVAEINAECRLKVLSSQLEDSFFIIKFTAVDPNTKNSISSIKSHPIKVISKPEQIKDRIKDRKTTKSNKVLMANIDEMIETAKENDIIIDKLSSISLSKKSVEQDIEIQFHQLIKSYSLLDNNTKNYVLGDTINQSNLKEQISYLIGIYESNKSKEYNTINTETNIPFNDNYHLINQQFSMHFPFHQFVGNFDLDTYPQIQ
eukprot:TRINITY_DN808_c1_g1_i1.p1 TRINITY_DN808_c1_g1~~TRINITY_DN808_c1_g1_i1.p1  ORF type:complete len:292 (-),score=101.16 TRINITY_DN808_c1_g1_i1:240-1115(-)